MIAIDPGPLKSAWMIYQGGCILDMGIDKNDHVLALLRGYYKRQSGETPEHTLVIEWIETFGMSVGRDVFETVYWTGRFSEAYGGGEDRVTRRQVKQVLCGSHMKVKDSDIRQALIDRFGGIGGKQAAVGDKKNPGPLYGVRKDLWSALAVAVTYEAITIDA